VTDLTPGKVTRRQLALVVAGSAVAAAQATPDWFAQAVESKRKAAVELAAVDVPMSVEPAFQFKP
jgi:hypothetical protein